MPSIEFEHIVKTYGSVTVLDDLNLKVEDGDFLVLLGASGCGKSTLLNMLAGLTEVTDGRISIDGVDVTEFDPRDRSLAMVFQSYALYPTKTVYGNLKFGLSAQNLPKDEIEKRINWAAKLLKMEALLNRKPANLSGGQRQRVAIGRALVKNVDVFLFDEPLSNLDAKLRTNMRLEIKKLHDELKQTIVYVTHDQIEAMTMATKIAVMDAGVIQQFATPAEIYEKPANLFVADFIGSPAMNLMAATVKTLSKGVSAVLSNGVVIDLSDYEFEVNPKDGQKIIVGMRPEHFKTKLDTAVAAELELSIAYTERTGSDATIFLNYEDELMAIRIGPDEADSLQKGDIFKTQFPMAKANLYDPQSGIRL